MWEEFALDLISKLKYVDKDSDKFYIEIENWRKTFVGINLDKSTFLP